MRKDKKTEIKYLHVAADGGVAFAQYVLAVMYKTGETGLSEESILIS